MNASFRLVLCLAALLSARAALADDDSAIKVDVVVDITDAGKNIPRPTPAHPAYFYPYTCGYTLGQGFVGSEPPPPPTVEVQRLIAKALAEQGYLLATKKSPPSLVLIFWWGYKAPVMEGETDGGAASVHSKNGGGIGGSPAAAGNKNNSLQGGLAYQVGEAVQAGLLPTNQLTNGSEMEDLVFGSNNDRNTSEWHPSLRLQALNDEARTARYYVTVSALDFAAAAQRKQPIVLWTAHMSTDLYGHTLDQVLPSLIAAGAPLFGKDTGGALWPLPLVPLTPMGRVEVGTPYVKTYPTPPTAP